MFNFIASILGKLMRWTYDSLSANFAEPTNISFYAIAIILMTLLVSLMIIPMTISQQKQAERTKVFKPKEIWLRPTDNATKNATTLQGRGGNSWYFWLFSNDNSNFSPIWLV